METNKLTEKPFAQVAAAIQALDLETVKARLMDPELGEGWTREYADSIEAAYKTYLTMVAKYQEDAEDIMLAKDVDEFWHTHILQTMKYSADCETVFGTYLHHNPHVGPRTAADLSKREEMAAKTRHLYAQEFADADAAWAGGSPRSAAFSSAAVSAGAAAFSSAAIREASAAFSSAAIAARDAAFSSAAIRAERAAFSSAAVGATGAAFSSAAIQAKDAAFSSAAIQAKDAAFSSAAIPAKDAAFSSAAIQAKNAAFSSAAISAESAAFSSAARPHART
ncbi:MAG TPA: hypothetical protein VHP37_29075 [Burkholderiales bacterium]|nr:hypothetical protein [Burkholderiales bacterium]